MRLDSLVFASAKSQFPIGEGGGETIIRDLLLALHERGVQVEANGAWHPEKHPVLEESLSQLGGEPSLTEEDGTCAYTLGYPTRLVRREAFARLVEARINESDCQVVLVQAVDSWEAIEVATRLGRVPIFYAQNGLELETYPMAESLPLVLANSRYFQERLRGLYSMPVELLYPAVDLDKYRVEENSRRYITMINPVVVKGIAYVLKLALAHPEREFLVVEGWGTPPEILSLIERIENVTWWDKQVDMRAVYAQTDILLVPSQWNEAFGRVITEAQINGIPVLASRVGGIPESLGSGGVLVEEIQNPEAWSSGLAEVVSRYDELSSLAREHAAGFSSDRAADRLLEIVSSLAL